MKQNEININELILNIRRQYSSLLLFGSHSRGDNNKNSDIDILQVTNEYFPSYSNGHYNISVYTLSQLTNMAIEGSLFVLHLIKEAKIVYGDKDLIQDLLVKKFNSPKTYDNYRKELVVTSDVLDVNETTYFANWKGFNNLLCYLFRSYLYSKAYDSNNLTFSINTIANQFDDEGIIDVFLLKRMEYPNFKKYLEGKEIYEEYAGKKFINIYKDPRELLNKMKIESKLMTALSLHFIKDAVGDPTY